MTERQAIAEMRGWLQNKAKHVYFFMAKSARLLASSAFFRWELRWPAPSSSLVAIQKNAIVRLGFSGLFMERVRVWKTGQLTQSGIKPGPTHARNSIFEKILKPCLAIIIPFEPWKAKVTLCRPIMHSRARLQASLWTLKPASKHFQKPKLGVHREKSIESPLGDTVPNNYQVSFSTETCYGSHSSVVPEIDWIFLARRFVFLKDGQT